MPVPGEPVERSADDLTGPGDDERVGRRVVGTRHRGGEARAGPVGLRRALVEVELVPRSGLRLGLPGDLAVLEADAGGGDGLAGLRVGRIGGDAKGDGTERDRAPRPPARPRTGAAREALTRSGYSRCASRRPFSIRADADAAGGNRFVLRGANVRFPGNAGAALPTSAGREHIGISIDTSALADSHVLVDCVRADFEEIASCTRTEPPRAPDERRHAVATCRPEPQ